jgi:hypothetical protein
VFTSGNYGSNTSALSGSNRWDTSTGTPVQNLLDAIATPFIRPNVMVIGEQAWYKLLNNPEVKSYITGRPSTSAGATPLLMDTDTFAKAFGLEAVYVGRAKYNSAREGATVSSSYIWGKSCALIKVEAQPNARRTACFAYTFRFGAVENRVIPDLINGVRGGNWVKVSHSDDEELVAGSNAGYLYTTVVS